MQRDIIETHLQFYEFCIVDKTVKEYLNIQ